MPQCPMPLCPPLARACVVLVAGLILFGTARAAEPPVAPAKVSFFKDIRPLVQTHCQGCHQPAKPLGSLVMTSFDAIKKGGESGQPGLVPGKPDESPILKQLLSEGGNAPAMPKGRPPLKPVEVELIRRWITEGAVDDSPMTERESIDAAHPPVYQAAPVVTSVAYSPDGNLIAVSGYHEVLLHSADGGKLVARLVGLSERIESAVFSPDGKSLAVTGGSPGRFGEVQVWDVPERKLKLSLSVTYDTIYGASWSVDGTRIAFGCADNTVRAIDASNGQQVLFQGAHSDWVLNTVWSSDSSHLISVSRDRSMKLTEVATQRFVDNITSITPGALKGGLLTVDRQPGKDVLVIGGADGIPKLYKTYREQTRVIGDDFNKIREFPAVAGRIYSARFSQDGARIVVGSSSDGVGDVRVYTTEDGKQLWKVESPVPAVYSVCFSPDGKSVAAGGFDGLIRLYSADTGQLIKEFAAAPVSPAVAAGK